MIAALRSEAFWGWFAATFMAVTAVTFLFEKPDPRNWVEAMQWLCIAAAWARINLLRARQ
jgi:hypothetical protein